MTEEVQDVAAAPLVGLLELRLGGAGLLDGDDVGDGGGPVAEQDDPVGQQQLLVDV